MSPTATKGEAEREMVAAWEALGSAVDSFSDTEMEQPGVMDDWTVKDLLGHIAFWAQEGARNLELIAGDKASEIRRPSSDAETNEWNQRERRLRAGQSLSEIREEWLESFQRAMAALASLPADKLEQDVGGRNALELFAVDTYHHYREHLGDLHAWRRQLETTET